MVVEAHGLDQNRFSTTGPHTTSRIAQPRRGDAAAQETEQMALRGQSTYPRRACASPSASPSISSSTACHCYCFQHNMEQADDCTAFPKEIFTNKSMRAGLWRPCRGQLGALWPMSDPIGLRMPALKHAFCQRQRPTLLDDGHRGPARPRRAGPTSSHGLRSLQSHEHCEGLEERPWGTSCCGA